MLQSDPAQQSGAEKNDRRDCSSPRTTPSCTPFQNVWLYHKWFPESQRAFLETSYCRSTPENWQCCTRATPTSKPTNCGFFEVAKAKDKWSFVSGKGKPTNNCKAHQDHQKPFPKKELSAIKKLKMIIPVPTIRQNLNFNLKCYKFVVICSIYVFLAFEIHR